MNDIDYDQDVKHESLSCPSPQHLEADPAVFHDVIWLEMVASYIAGKDWDQFILVLDGIIKRLKGLVPNRADIHDKIDASVPLDLIKQMLENEAIQHQDFVNYFTTLLLWVRDLGIPERDALIEEQVTELKDIEVPQNGYEKILPLLILRIHCHIDLIEFMIKRLHVKDSKEN